MKTLESIIEKARKGEIVSLSPVFKKLQNISENDSFHDNDPVYNHTIRVMDNLEKLTGSSRAGEVYFNEKIGRYKRKDLLLVSAVFHDTGKLIVYSSNNGITSCPGHEEKSAVFTADYFRDRIETGEIKYILDIIKWHGKPHKYLRPDNINIEADFDMIEKEAADIFPDILFFIKADVYGSQLRAKNTTLFRFINTFLDSRISRCFNS